MSRPGAADQDVVPGGADEDVVAAGAVDRVLDGAAGEHVVEGRADHVLDRDERVAAAADRVLAARGGEVDGHADGGEGVVDGVEAGAAVRHVVALEPAQAVVAARCP